MVSVNFISVCATFVVDKGPALHILIIIIHIHISLGISYSTSIVGVWVHLTLNIKVLNFLLGRDTVLLCFVDAFSLYETKSLELIVLTSKRDKLIRLRNISITLCLIADKSSVLIILAKMSNVLYKRTLIHFYLTYQNK